MKRDIKIYRVVFIILIFCILSVSLGQAKDDYDLYTISQINQHHFRYGTYLIEGYVVHKYDCAKKERQEPESLCEPAHIIISEDRRKSREGKLSDSELIVFVKETDSFLLRKKYRFLIQITDVKTTDQKINNVKLIYFEEG